MLVFGLTKRLPTGGSFISNTLRTGRVARCITQFTRDKVFFNRKRELAMFKKAFSGDPELHVVLGPPSTGKTALIREVTSKGDFSPLFINCREGQFFSPNRVYDSITSEFEKFSRKYKEPLKELLMQGEVSYTLNDIRRFSEDPFSDIGKALPNWTRWSDYNIPPPILVIDEANMFSQITVSEEGKVFLRSILNWMVVNTKEEGHFHIVLTSSDSFFFNWIANFLHIPHVRPYVVGDLSKKEAEEYFEEHVLSQYECKELEGKFDHVCKMTGTRMLIINKYVKEYTYEGKLADNEFSIYVSEYSKLKNGLNPKEFKYSDKPNPPLWNDDDLFITMEAIVKAEDQGYILEDDLIEKISRKKVNSLINYNFLHRRPTNRFANDISYPLDKIILTAMNQPSVRAMEQILSEVASNKK